MNKFTTIKASLFNKNNQNNIPDWMNDIDIKDVDKKELNIEFDTKKAWAENPIINRDDRDYTSKEVTAKINNNGVLLAKIELSKFLGNKYYDIKEADIKNNNVLLKTIISNVPGEFTFIYNIDNNHIKQNSIFYYDTVEYPFSNAGFEECLTDIKNKKVTASTKVSNIDKASIISAEEIYRRYNGHIRQATDRINELLKDGSIVGVTSNSYGTFYDIDYLFPQMEKEGMPDKAPEFEFVKNIEKTATTEHKSAYQLAMEASKQFEDVYDDFEFVNYERNNDKLKITAKVLDNNRTYTKDFYFDINNEKLNNDISTFSKTLIDNGVEEPKQKRLNTKNIISKKYVNDLLKSSGFFDFNINDMFDNLTINGYINPINEDKYTTKYSLSEILDKMNLKNQNKDKYYKLVDKVTNLKLNRNKVKDTGVREDIKFSKEYRLATLNNYLSQKFNKFYIKDFKQLDNDNYEANVIFSNDGIKNKLHIYVNYNGTKLNEVKANLQNKQVPIKEATKLFKKSTALKTYLNKNSANIFTDKIVLTLDQIYKKLSNFVDTAIINDIINDWINNNYIINIGGDTFASDYTFEELLEKSNIEILSDEEINNLINLKQYFGEGQDFNREDVKDTGIRETEEYVSHQTLINSINQYLSNYFNDFIIEELDINNSNNQSNVFYKIKVFNEDNGLSLNLNINFLCEGNSIKESYCAINGKNVSLDEIKNVFIINESLNKYLTMFNGKKVKANIIISRKALKDKLSKIADIDDESLDGTIELLIKNNKMDRIANDTFASKYTLEELINYSNLKPLSDEEFLEKIKKAQLNKLMRLSKNYLDDNDTRDLIDNWSDNDIMIYISSKLNQIFKNYDVLNFEFDRNKYVVSINATDKDGLNKTMLCYFNVDSNHPGEIIEITNLNNQAEEISQYLQYNKPNLYNNKGIITRQQLIDQLYNVVDVNNIDEIIIDLNNNDILYPISNNRYIVDCTMSDIVAYLSKNNKTNLVEGKNRLISAINNVDKVDTDIKQDIETDTRELYVEDKLSINGEQIRDNLFKKVKDMYDNKKITLNKLNEIKNNLDNSKNEIDLNKIHNELNRYLQ